MFEGTAAHPTGGFEFGIARDLARRFGLARVRIVTVPFDRLVRGQLGGADLALALLTPTPARERVLDFSDPYLQASPAVLVRRGVGVPDLETARSLHWAVQRHTTLADILTTQIQPTRPVLDARAQSTVVSLLETGRAQATLLDLPEALAVVDRSDGALRVAAQLEQPEDIAAALPKGSPNDQAVDSAVRALVTDGSVNALEQRWLGPAASGDGQSIPLLESTR
jgi:polar amino acid transport system substrate-binding protein